MLLCALPWEVRARRLARRPLAAVLARRPELGTSIWALTMGPFTPVGTPMASPAVSFDRSQGDALRNAMRAGLAASEASTEGATTPPGMNRFTPQPTPQASVDLSRERADSGGVSPRAVLKRLPSGVLNELEALRRENERLKGLLRESSSTATVPEAYHTSSVPLPKSALSTHDVCEFGVEDNPPSSGGAFAFSFNT